MKKKVFVYASETVKLLGIKHIESEFQSFVEGVNGAVVRSHDRRRLKRDVATCMGGDRLEDSCDERQ